eukprot:GSChrysophyteH2.ASY1.ANO1.1184.1 assembled CDS
MHAEEAAFSRSSVVCMCISISSLSRPTRLLAIELIQGSAFSPILRICWSALKAATSVMPTHSISKLQLVQEDAAEGEYWQRRQHQHRPVRGALTGVAERMRTLPYVSISAPAKHTSDHVPQTMLPDAQCCVGGATQERMEGIAQGGGARKCVYNYEDKYTFARIVTADSLIFDSHFESANLYVCVCEWEPRQCYDLYMHNDVHTTQHTQWFYFSVSNTRAGNAATFFLRNYSKPDSMFNQGMRPLLYERDGGATAATAGAGAGASSSGGKEKKKKTGSSSCDYTCSFTHTFEYSDDICYFAFCHPYTYTDLQRHLQQIEADSQRSSCCRQSTLCTTIAGNRCPLLTITAPARSLAELQVRVYTSVCVCVHPGETNASWIVHGLLEFLTGNTRAAVQLRSTFVFKVVPMLNPDGVINGNYRCSLSGQDLNRQWSTPCKDLHPTIYHTKRLIRRVKQRWLVGLVLDIHGHSRKHGVFTYVCFVHCVSVSLCACISVSLSPVH